MHFLRVSGLLFLLLLISAQSELKAQTELQKKIERYLFVSFDTNKASLKENERILRYLDESLDLYIVAQTDQQLRDKIKQLEKQADENLKQLEQLRDPMRMIQLIEENKKSSRLQLEQFFSQGLSSVEDVVICRKLINLKLLEFYLMQQKQDKLRALLRDDNTRKAFIESLINRGKLNENTDLRAMAQTLELEVVRYEI